MEDAVKQKRFLWGVLLAWAPWLPIMIGVSYAFRGIGNSKAIGLEAMAGGLAEAFVLWGTGAMIVAQIVAIVLLIKAFSSANVFRNVFSVFSIALSVLMLFFVGLFLWMSWYAIHHRF